MAVGDAYVFPGFLTQLSFPKPPTTFPTWFCRGERRKYARKKSRLNRGSNSQPPGHESDTITTEPPGRGCKRLRSKPQLKHFKFHYFYFPLVAFKDLGMDFVDVPQNIRLKL